MAKQQAKGGAAAAKRQRGKRREKKNVPRGQAHIQSTFNNTIVTITDPSGNVVLLGKRRPERLQGLAQEHALCRAAHGRVGSAQGDGERHAVG